MSDNDMAAFQQEGYNPFEAETTDEDTSADSPSEEENQGGDTPSAEGENTQTHDTIPFDQHPRWKEREDDWTRRFNDQEARHQNDIKAIREEFSTARKENANNTKIPSWFGGDQAQWDAYRADRDAELQSAEERAEKRVIERFQSQQSDETKATEEATKFLRSEIAAIEADRTINPSGEKVDAEKLFKVVFENKLIDTEGRWNYRAGYKLLKAEGGAAAPTRTPQQQARKEAAASTSSDNRGEAPKRDFATSEDFKKSRPW